MNTAQNNITLLETVKLFNDTLIIEKKNDEQIKTLGLASEKIENLIDTFVEANEPPQCMTFVRQHLEWFKHQIGDNFPMISEALDKIIALDKKTRIEVGRFPNGFATERHNWCGWLRHHNIETSFDFVGSDSVIYATPWMAKAVWGMQISNPARFGNCPAIKKYLAVPKSKETDKDRDFVKAFYAKETTWEQKVALAEAYMVEEPVVIEVKEETPPETKIGECCDCGKVKEVIFDVCPYDADINGGTEKVWKCQECRDAACQEI